MPLARLGTVCVSGVVKARAASDRLILGGAGPGNEGSDFSGPAPWKCTRDVYRVRPTHLFVRIIQNNI